VRCVCHSLTGDVNPVFVHLRCPNKCVALVLAKGDGKTASADFARPAWRVKSSGQQNQEMARCSAIGGFSEPFQMGLVETAHVYDSFSGTLPCHREWMRALRCECPSRIGSVAFADGHG
jgi:hypothetical protein